MRSHPVSHEQLFDSFSREVSTSKITLVHSETQCTRKKLYLFPSATWTHVRCAHPIVTGLPPNTSSRTLVMNMAMYVQDTTLPYGDANRNEPRTAHVRLATFKHAPRACVWWYAHPTRTRTRNHSQGRTLGAFFYHPTRTRNPDSFPRPNVGSFLVSCVLCPAAPLSFHPSSRQVYVYVPGNATLVCALSDVSRRGGFVSLRLRGKSDTNRGSGGDGYSHQGSL